jgi:hypothetical protein
MSGDAMCGLGVWWCWSFTTKNWWFFPQGVLQCFSKILLSEARFLLPPSSHHLGITLSVDFIHVEMLENRVNEEGLLILTGSHFLVLHESQIQMSL